MITELSAGSQDQRVDFSFFICKKTNTPLTPALVEQISSWSSSLLPTPLQLESLSNPVWSSDFGK